MLAILKRAWRWCDRWIGLNDAYQAGKVWADERSERIKS